jgi:hypothetical protein
MPPDEFPGNTGKSRKTALQSIAQRSEETAGKDCAPPIIRMDEAQDVNALIFRIRPPDQIKP